MSGYKKPIAICGGMRACKQFKILMGDPGFSEHFKALIRDLKFRSVV
jgi:hypothetical protein